MQGEVRKIQHQGAANRTASTRPTCLTSLAVAKLIDAVAFLEFKYRVALLVKNGKSCVIPKANLEQLLADDEQQEGKLLTEDQRHILKGVANNWQRYTRTAEIDERQLSKICNDVDYKNFATAKKRTARGILYGLNAVALDAVSINTIVFRFKIEEHLETLRKDETSSPTVIHALEQLLEHFDLISHDGFTISPGQLFKFARYHELSDLLLDQSTAKTVPATKAPTSAWKLPTMDLASLPVRHG